MTKIYKFSNQELVTLLKEVLAAMEVKNFNFFRIRAYQNVIGVIDSLTQSVYNLWENKKIDEIPGIGSAIKHQLNELFSSGKVTEYDAIRSDLPQGMFELIGLRGIGSKKAYKLASAFSLTDRATALEIIKKAAEEEKIRALEGFGEKSEEQILDSISNLKMTKSEKTRMLLSTAEEIAARFVSYLKEHTEIEDAIALGSLRRKNPTVGDLDVVIMTESPEIAQEHILKYPEIEEILVKGDQRSSFVLANDVQVDTRFCQKNNLGSMMQYFTGSLTHNISLRTYALTKGASLSEYGIKKGGVLHEFSNEKNFYDFLDLDYITPELRQGKNEVELAAKKKLPALIELQDIKGDLHTHTIASDGVNTLQEMVNAAIEKGYDYLGITDHAPSTQSRGYEEVAEIISSTRRTIDSLNSVQKDIKVLYGYEVNILADATISLPDELLKLLDYAIASIHSAFNQDREMLTKRLIAGAENPYINIIGHPSGRLINEREACDIEWRDFFSAVKDNNKIVEINSQPNRLDLPEDLVEQALEKGIDLMINTDSHSIEQLELMSYGVYVARRGWCTKHNIINTLPFEAFMKKLKSSSAR